MLKSLTVKNIALIDNAVIDFSDGLNVLTGETGAGKSLIINSLGMLKGTRAAKELIRSGEDSASVTGLFEINDKVKEKIYNLCGIECDDEIIISRTMNVDGKNNIRLNGNPIILSMLKEIGELLVNIHSQHDGTVLLNKHSHIGFLDDYGGTDIKKAHSDYLEAFNKWNEIKAELKKVLEDESDKEQRLDMLKFRVGEIEEAALKAGEDAELEERRNLLSNSRKIAEACYNAYALLYDSESENPSAYDLLYKAVKETEDVSEFDKTISDCFGELNDAMYSVSENAKILKDFCDNLNYDEQELNYIEDRLDLISSLKKKYGQSIEEIIEYYDKISLELSDIENSDEKKEQLILEEKECSHKVDELATVLTEVRKKYSLCLAEGIKRELCDLEMPQVKFEVEIHRGDYSSSGKDDVEFMICTNVGEGVKPLSKIASGGELSRIILAIKNVLYSEKTAETLIFDEVDTGVSGKIAQRIGEKLYSMAKYSQVICITHLPQMAAFNDVHFKISKSVGENRTVTNIDMLDDIASIEEIARLLGGEVLTDITRENAKELVNSSNEIKNKYI